ncbi:MULTISPECIES: O-methyltransferase [Pseudonocardia]|jgi:predicted O-methyltransferase YrrM|uniref:O-methyltransferase n=1 Tax=Pseudonocardia alni subsp. carboxydivorans TaxID=415010 RepID=A0ABU9AFR6_PSEA5|nr:MULTISPECIES: O-methyltransferase [Pseudonocardia]NWJ71216.1 O-methyltransferase [Pseudonocardia pini]ALE80529.1 methyltransferase [Pseudonocardia sp. AL041005-10]MBO4237042.1 methyltransferase domain-containing protein [Pseudonocardia alni]MCO7194691.1 O-methyltransferase [Pseudonocardia sp. McavD-2-B]WFG43080.1 O-methyltransferase [Pseudonocardia alni]
MSTPAGAAAYAEGYLAEDDACGEARALGTAAGAHPISAAGGAALSVLAATVSARAVVEIGTGAGVSGLYLLRGMAGDGTLTTIDVDPELQRSARRTFLAAGYGPGRARLINGMALEVLPRLTDGGYDLVVADAVPAEYPGYLAEAIRLLRPGGVLVLEGVLDGGRVAEPGAAHGPGTAALRETAALVRDDERLLSALLPVADGMLCAVRR